MILNLGSRVVNSYLISSDVGCILIDTGYAGGFPRFLKKLEKNNIRPEEIKFVFLTHAHDDHAGFLNEVLAATDAEVILQKAPAMLYPGHGKPFRTSDLQKYRASLERIRLYPLKERAAD